jgi:hypothetical protein
MNTKFKIYQMVVVLIFLTTMLQTNTFAQYFRAAAVKVDITPENSQWLLGYGPRQSTGVLDRIYHRILVLDDGENLFCLVSSDICLVSPAAYDALADRVFKNLAFLLRPYGGRLPIPIPHLKLVLRAYRKFLWGIGMNMNGTGNTLHW